MHRRALLATGAAAMAYSVAGCLGGDGGSGEPVAFESWLPGPDIFGRGEYPTPFRYFDVPSLVDQEDDLGDFFETYGFDQTDPVLSIAGLELRDLDLYTTSPDLYAAAEGDFDIDAVQETIDGDDRFVEETEDGDMTIYSVEGFSNAGALGLQEGLAVRVGDGDLEGDQIFFAPSNVDRVEAVSSIVAASEDEASRYTANEFIGTLADELGSGDVGFGERRTADETSIPNSEFSNQEAWGAEFDVSGGTTNFTEVFVFASDASPPEADLEDWLSRDTPHDWGSETQPSDTSIEIEENVAVVTGEFDTSDGFEIL